MKLINKKMTAGLLIIFILAVTGALSACAENNTANSPAQGSGSVPAQPEILAQPETPEQEETPAHAETPVQGESTAQPEAPAGLFGSFGGTITEIAAYYETDDKTERPGWYFVSVKDRDGQDGTIAITDKTFFATDAELTVGATIIGFYDMTAPMPAIYPPRYNAQVVAINLPDSESVKVDKFDDNLVSSDNMLRLNIADTTGITTQDGKSFDGSLADRTLVVFYTISTRSIPAQTTPDKIIVLSDEKQD